ncbi:tripartite tricarboxylate transporter substrate binding protein [Rhodovarius crocodyli]|uniref:Tripartite tricarboxylate transporter substrate binding protein n=1 Tax=Rhodovarius crocodyli TaxID=1979269 RepID=A0A437LX50_9PROT|nr:tripartite tricarboxylate transporter substrate binding protein [Rhodovarius crocodyli]RVT89949.1 tripartite tricarboxylate transporter substrate binding protein [Rhodovarius crocodyli]
MTTTRRLLLAAPALLATPFAASAQERWSPTRPVRIIVGFSPGGTTDIAARILAEFLSHRLGQSVVVENRPGAGGNIANEVVAKGETDGHTLLMQTIGGGAINFPLYGNRMPIKPEDLVALGLLLRVPNAIFVNPSLPVNSLQELVAYARARPGQLNYGSSGLGTSLHMTAELLKMVAEIDITHVPFRGSGPMLQEVLAGRVQMAVDNLPSVVNHLREGRLRPLAVTSATRSPALPNVPTTAEAGFPAVEAVAWFGLQGPARMPAAAVQRYGAEIDAAVKDNGVWSKLADLGGMKPDLTPDGGTSPEGFTRYMAAELQKWTDVVRRARVTLEG